MKQGEINVLFKVLMELRLDTQAVILQLAETSISTDYMKISAHPKLVEGLREVPQELLSAYKATIPQEYFKVERGDEPPEPEEDDTTRSCPRCGALLTLDDIRCDCIEKYPAIP